MKAGRLAAALALFAAGGSQAKADVEKPPACVDGEWRATANGEMPPIRFESEHFAFRWAGEATNADAVRPAAEHLERAWRFFIDATRFREPHCDAVNKLKINVHLDPTFGLSGGVDDQGQPGMWISPPALTDRFGLAHEFVHALQGSTGGLRDSPYAGWMWESHANWMTTQLPEFRGNTHCSVFLVNHPHIYYGSTRDRYCNWQFWEHLKNRYGYAAVNDIWRKAPKAGEVGQAEAGPFSVLMANQGWSIDRLNDEFGQWALRNAHWDYTNPDGSDQGAIYRKSYGDYDPQGGDRYLRTTVLNPIDLAARRFAVPAAWAPQRWGYNMVRLHADAGARAVAVSFRGVVQRASAVAKLPGLADEPATIAPPASDWRWGIVAVGADGKSRYTTLQRGADGEASLPLQPGDTGLFLVVMATPSQFQKIRWDQPYYSIYRYPWMIELSGAMPAGFQPGAPSPIAGGRRHANGGGWIGPDATVDSTAYVGPYARVIAGSLRGRARLEDHAVLDGGQMQDDAAAAGLSIITGNTIIKDNARVAATLLGIGELEKGIVLSGTAQLIGDVEQRGASLSSGVHYGFIDATTAADPKRGAALTTPVAEVTAAPDYRWRP
jgi:hypothetical protein